MHYHEIINQEAILKNNMVEHAWTILFVATGPDLTRYFLL